MRSGDKHILLSLALLVRILFSYDSERAAYHRVRSVQTHFHLHNHHDTMGGEGPYVRFDPAYHSGPWASHTGLTLLNDEELEAAYSRAKDFLMDKKRELVDVHGWSVVQPEDDGVRTTQQ